MTKKPIGVHYELELPYPPTINHYYTNCVRFIKGRKRRFRAPSAKAKDFLNLVAMRCAHAHVRDYSVMDKYQVVVEVYPPDKRKRDLDNILKPLLDGLEMGGCFEDDFQVWRLSVERKEVIKKGLIKVRIIGYN